MTVRVFELVQAIQQNEDAVINALPHERRSEFRAKFNSVEVALTKPSPPIADINAKLVALLEEFSEARAALIGIAPSISGLLSPPPPETPSPSAAPPRTESVPKIEPTETPTVHAPSTSNNNSPVLLSQTARLRATDNPPGAGKPATGLQWLREITTTALAVIIVVFTLLIAARGLGVIENAAQTQAAKDILAVLLGPAGVVVGYYFGRVPAEGQATEARQRTEAAVLEQQRTRAEAERTARDLRALEGEIQQSSLSRGESPSVVLNQLREIQERLRSI